MTNVINDPTFGHMIYRHSWERSDTQIFFGKELKIKIVVEAYTGQTITYAQRAAYQKYLKNKTIVLNHIEQMLLRYYLDNTNKCSVDEDSILKTIVIDSLYFDRNGQYGLLCKCDRDNDGMCILLSNDEPTIKDYDYLF